MVSKQASPIPLHSWEVTPCRVLAHSERQDCLLHVPLSWEQPAVRQDPKELFVCWDVPQEHTHISDSWGCPTAPSQGAPSAPALQVSVQDQSLCYPCKPHSIDNDTNTLQWHMPVILGRAESLLGRARQELCCSLPSEEVLHIPIHRNEQITIWIIIEVLETRLAGWYTVPLNQLVLLTRQFKSFTGLKYTACLK